MTLENQTVDNVSKKILEDAYAEKEKIINDARTKEKEILKTADDKRKIIIKNAETQAQDTYRKVKELGIENAVMKFNQEGLLSKIRFIEKISGKALDKLESSDSKLYLKFIENSIKSLKIRKAYYQIGSREKLITDKILKTISGDIILEPGGKAADFEKGIKIIDGKKQYIISVEETLKEKMEDITMEISDFLFEKE
jgi:vacuolar-type H+-ATPase subunit E/Vma4